jgi:hypothetical protein
MFAEAQRMTRMRAKTGAACLKACPMRIGSAALVRGLG